MSRDGAARPDGDAADAPAAAAAPAAGRDADASDAQLLGRLGYAQELARRIGGFGNFALSFSVISILTGAVSLYGYGLRYGGPFAVAAGWTLVALMTLPVALAMAELASAYPTAGALYHWSSLLGGRGLGWLTAWLNLLGQFAILAAIDWGLVELLLPAGSTGTKLCAFLALLGSHAALNHFGVGVVNLLARVSAWYHLVGVALLVGALAALAPHQPLAFLLRREVAPSADLGGAHGWPWAFAISLLMAGWTFTGYDASAHASEETHDAGRAAPTGILSAVIVSALFGGAMLVAVTLSIRDVARVADPVAGGFGEAMAEAFPARPLVGRALTAMASGAMWFCGLASLTAGSRTLYAFARDGGMPASRLFARVSPRFRTPASAVWLTSAIALLLVGLCLGWGAARDEAVGDVLGRVSSVSTVGLYLSYGLPIACALAGRRTGRFARRGPFALGRFGGPVGAVAVLWLVALSVVSMLPPNGVVALLVAGYLAALAVYWLVWQRARFRGPALLSDTFTDGR